MSEFKNFCGACCTLLTMLLIPFVTQDSYTSLALCVVFASSILLFKESYLAKVISAVSYMSMAGMFALCGIILVCIEQEQDPEVVLRVTTATGWFLFCGIVFIVLAISHQRQSNNSNNQLNAEQERLKLAEEIANMRTEALNKLNEEKAQKTNAIDMLKSEIEQAKSELNDLKEEKRVLKLAIDILAKNALCAQYDFSEYDGLTSEECKNKLALLKSEEKEQLRSGGLVKCNGTESKKMTNDNIKQIIRCFNAECDNVLLSVSAKNIDAMRNKITKSFESLNRIFDVDDVQMSRKFLKSKLEQLNLVYTYELKAEQERERQREIKAQMLEEEKVRREIEREKAKLEKDQTQCSKEMQRLMSYMQKTQNDVEKQLYIDKIKELEEKVKELESQKETVLEREANARAGFVYVISNIGSFGENVYKIGMTRRLEPMDRIKELSDASVPFAFDVHAMIFSDDAPALETTLHKAFEKRSVNRVNNRKEFFKVSIDEIEKVVLEKFNNTAQFTKIPVAQEYNETLQILQQEQSA